MQHHYIEVQKIDRLAMEDREFDEGLLQDGASLTAIYLASLPQNEAETLLSYVSASYKVCIMTTFRKNFTEDI